jgi:hypothetical protein
MRDLPLLADRTLAQPLAEQGLLHLPSPETLVDESVAEPLTDLLDKMITAGAFDRPDPSEPFVELSYSRLGGYGDAKLTDIILERLQDRGLARSTQDGVLFPCIRPDELSCSSYCHSCCAPYSIVRLWTCLDNLAA